METFTSALHPSVNIRSYLIIDLKDKLTGEVDFINSSLAYYMSFSSFIIDTVNNMGEEEALCRSTSFNDCRVIFHYSLECMFLLSIGQRYVVTGGH